MPIKLTASSKLEPDVIQFLEELSSKTVNRNQVPLFVSYQNQRIGIFTTTPGYPLDIQGNVGISGTLVLGTGQVLGMLAAHNLDVSGQCSTNVFNVSGTASIRNLDTYGVANIPTLGGTVTINGTSNGIILTGSGGVNKYLLNIIEATNDDGTVNPVLKITKQ